MSLLRRAGTGSAPIQKMFKGNYENTYVASYK